MRHVWAGLAGGAGFALLFLWAEMGILASLAGCAVAVGAVYLLAFRERWSGIGMDPDHVLAGLSLENGHRLSEEIRRLAARIPDPAIRAEAKAIGTVAEGILADLEAHPRDSAKARRFLDYYLESTRKILAKYVELSERNLSTPESRTTLDGIGGLLSEVRAGFEKQRSELAEGELMDLDVEMKLLRSTMRMDGGG